MSSRTLLGMAIVALAAGVVAEVFFSVTAPDLRPTCSGALPPDPPYGPDCWNGPRAVITQAGLLPGVAVALAVFAVLWAGARVSRRSPG